MTYRPTDFRSLRGIKGFGDVAFVEREMNVEELHWRMEDESAGSHVRAELRRRLGWEWNGMRLLELCFGNLGGTGQLARSSELRGKLEREFGGFVRYRREFQTAGDMRGTGRVILYDDPSRRPLAQLRDRRARHGPTRWSGPAARDERLGARVLPRPPYAFFANVDWGVVSMRLPTGLESRALAIGSEKPP